MRPFAAIDFETANAHRGSACSVGIAIFDECGRQVDDMSTLLKPHPQYSVFDRRNIRIHGIKPEMVEHSPEWSSVYPEVCRLIEDLPLVAHNMGFDGSVLNRLACTYGYEPFLNQRLCTVKISRSCLPELGCHTLDEVYRHYYPDRSFDHHDASADARVAGEIFVRMQEQFSWDDISRCVVHNRCYNADGTPVVSKAQRKTHKKPSKKKATKWPWSRL